MKDPSYLVIVPSSLPLHIGETRDRASADPLFPYRISTQKLSQPDFLTKLPPPPQHTSCSRGQCVDAIQCD